MKALQAGPARQWPSHRATLASGGGFAPSRVPAVKAHFAWVPSTSPRSPHAAIRLGQPTAYLPPRVQDKVKTLFPFSFSSQLQKSINNSN